MENSDIFFLSEKSIKNLSMIGKIANVVSVLGLLAVLISVLFLGYYYLSLYQIVDVPPGAGVGLIMAYYILVIGFLITILCFFPFYYLYKFSTNIKIAIRDVNNDDLEVSFKNLKYHFISIGILIVLYCLYYFVITYMIKLI